MSIPNLSFNLSLAPFSTGFAADPNVWAQEWVYNLSGSISGNLMSGSTADSPGFTTWDGARSQDVWDSSIDVWGPSAPTTDIGPWFDGSQWWAWDSLQKTYQPITQAQRVSSLFNGQTQVWQRKTSNTGAGYSADRFRTFTTLATGTGTTSQNTINIASSSLYPFTKYSARITVTGTESVLGATEYFISQYSVERQFARPLFGVRTSFSILLQSSVAGTYCVSIRPQDASVSFVFECVLTTANVPQYFQIENIPPFPVANYGTLDTDQSYSITICAGSGVNYQTSSKGVWTTGNFLATANQTNLFATASATLDFTLWQHENAPTCSAFMWTPFDRDRERCQRYYFKSLDYGTYVGATGTNLSYVLPVQTTLNSVGLLYQEIYKVPLRIAPTFGSSLNIYSSGTGASSKVYDLTAAADIAVNSVVSFTSFLSYMVLASNPTSNGFICFYYISDVDF